MGTASQWMFSLCSLQYNFVKPFFFTFLFDPPIIIPIFALSRLEFFLPICCYGDHIPTMSCLHHSLFIHLLHLHPPIIFLTSATCITAFRKMLNFITLCNNQLITLLLLLLLYSSPSSSSYLSSLASLHLCKFQPPFSNAVIPSLYIPFLPRLYSIDFSCLCNQCNFIVTASLYARPLSWIPLQDDCW